MKRAGEFFAPKLEVPFNRGIEAVRSSLAGLERVIVRRRLQSIGAVGRKLATVCQRHETCSTQTLIRNPEVSLLRFSVETIGFSFESEKVTEADVIQIAAFRFDHQGKYQEVAGLVEEADSWPREIELSSTEIYAETGKLELALANPRIRAQLATTGPNYELNQAYAALLASSNQN